MNDLENEYVIDRQGTAWRAIDVFKIGEAQGTHNERLRIIKLLESYALKKCDVHCAYSCECFGKYEAQRFIALIKGEQK